MNNTRKEHVQPTAQNINDTIVLIEKYAKDKGYQLIKFDQIPPFGESRLTFWKTKLKFPSKTQEKVMRDFVTRLHKNVTMSQANRFLHRLWKHVLGDDSRAPKVEYSQHELKIKESRRKWREAKITADKLQGEYKEIKGNFYK